MFDFFSLFRFTIGKQIFLGFGLVMVVFAGQAVIGNLGFDNAVTHFTRYGETNREVRTILEIERNVLDLQRGVLAFTYSGYAGVAQRVKELQAVLTNQIETVRGKVGDAQRTDVLRRMGDNFRLYAGNFDAAIEERTLRDRLVFERMMVLGDEIVTLLEVIHDSALERGDIQGAEMAGAAQGKLLLAQRDALQFLIKPKSNLVGETKRRLALLSGSLERLIDHLDAGAEMDSALRAKALAPQFEKAFFGMVQATRAYMHLVYVVMGGEAAEIAFLARELKELTLREQEQVETVMTSSVDQTQRTTEYASLLAITLGLFLAWWISRNIAGPVRIMTRTLTSLARGQMNAEIPGKGRRDEIGAMAMAADVFKEKAHELENASRYKSEFLANMSHELRTPLNSLLILSKVLSNNEHGNLSHSQVDSATVIHESGSDLLRLINDILDLSKVEAGRMDLYVEEKSFADFISSIERMFRPVAEKKGLLFEANIGDGVPSALESDWSKVEQIVRNFLSNALKFTAEGSVTVRVEQPRRGLVFMSPDLTAANCVGVTVSDTGIGIPQDKREQIFEAFRQADGSTSRKFGGTGLGLSISRKFTELIGGEIKVESEEDHGSSFTLYLPLHFPSALDRVERAAKVGGKPGQDREEDARKAIAFRDFTRTILVVDDDRRNVFALKQALEGRVGQVLTAHNGRQALDVMNEHPDIDLVLMDIMMPEMNGYEAMQAIREQTRFSKLPVVALTAKAMPGDREQCLEAGASDYLAKPVDAEKLLLTLADWLGNPKIPIVPYPIKNGDDTILPKVRTLSNGDSTGEEERLREFQLGEPPITVLIVDDDMRNTFSLAQALQKKVNRVLMARDGVKALAELEKEREVSIVLMDIMMPNMDGLEAIREIRNRDDMRHLPIIALTAKTMPEDRKKCLEAGADDYLSKPVELESLLEKMRQWLKASPTRATGPSENRGKESEMP
ncbi:MAG: response regulator [Magnetococcales bacterium]|nr:response regulator [Magnetococcales bacterium]